MKIVFATNNQHKLDEIRSILGDTIEVLSLKDIGCDVDIPETGRHSKKMRCRKPNISTTTIISASLQMIRGWKLMHSTVHLVFILPAMPVWKLEPMKPVTMPRRI